MKWERRRRDCTNTSRAPQSKSFNLDEWNGKLPRLQPPEKKTRTMEQRIKG